MEFHGHNPNSIKAIPGQEGPILDIEKAQIMAEMENQYHDFARMYELFSQNPEQYLQAYPLMDPAVEQYIEIAEEDEEDSSEEDASSDLPQGETIFKVEFGGGPKIENKALAAREREQTMRVLRGHPEVQKYLEDPEEYEASHPTTAEAFKDFVQMSSRGVSPEYLERIGELQAEVLGAEKDYADAVKDMSPKELKRQIWKSRFTMLTSLASAFVIGGTGDEAEYVKAPGYWNHKAQLSLSMRVADLTKRELKRLEADQQKEADPNSPEVAVKNLLEGLKAQYGQEELGNALVRLRRKPGQELTLENLTPASNALLKGIDRLSDKYDQNQILEFLVDADEYWPEENL